MKRLLIVNNNLHIGGVQKSLVNLLNEISRDYEITLFLFRKTGAYLNEVPEGINIIEAKSFLKVLGMSLLESRNYSFLSYIARIFLVLITRVLGNPFAIKIALLFEPVIGEFDFAFSYLQPAKKREFYGGTNEYVLSKVNAKQKISFIHSDFENYRGDIKYSKKLYTHFNKIVFCSYACRNKFTNILPELNDQCFVVYNSNDYKDIIEKSKINTVKYNQTVNNILMITRLSAEKNINTAILAIKSYIKIYGSNIHLHIVGDGKERDSLEHIVESENLDEYVTFHSATDNPYRFMPNARLLLMTSKHEAAPLVFDEAAIIGLPIITTDTTSVYEMVVESGHGIICGYKSDEIAKAIFDIVNSQFNIHPNSMDHNKKLQSYINEQFKVIAR